MTRWPLRDWLFRAKEARNIAEQMPNPAAKALLLEVVAAYEKLAELPNGFGALPGKQSPA